MRKSVLSTLIYLLKRIKELATRCSLWLFVALYAREWTGVQFIVHEEASRIGKLMLKQWLARHRILHCARCLETGQLRNAVVDEAKVALCQRCFESGVECGAAKAAVELARP